MGRHVAQRKREILRKRKLISFVREDEPAYALPGMEGLLSLSVVPQVNKLNGGFKDSAFGDNKSRPIHRWIPWIAGFSSEFVRDVFSQYLPPKPELTITVLDPFCGVGTTLVETIARWTRR